MKRKGAIIAITLLLLVLLTGVFLIVFLNAQKEETPVEEQQVNTEYFSAYTDRKGFQNLPVMSAEYAKVGQVEEQGGGCYVIGVDGTTVDDYKAYLSKLEKAGFKKHSDNGEEGMEGYVYTASYTKKNLVVTISHAIKLDKTYISAALDLPLSEHLIYKDEYVKENLPGAKTKLHLVQLNNNGTSIIIQLKNGHFIVHDGGQSYDAPYLLDYLEQLAPDGQKPVIEGWFISHAHGDHYGAVTAIATNLSWADRLIVEGFYFTEPSQAFALATETTNAVWTTSRLNASFKNMAGERAGMYRPQFGQRYYFCDMAIDVTMTSEQYPRDSYYNDDFNDTSIWLMHQIEDQRFLYVGDSSHTGMRTVMSMFEQSYFDLDMFAVSHHGINVYDYFVEYCIADTLLYTVFRTKSMYEDSSAHAHVKEHARMQELAKESISHGEGTAVLTFPYTVGSYEIMPSFDWRYNSKEPGKPQRTVWGK